MNVDEHAALSFLAATSATGGGGVISRHLSNQPGDERYTARPHTFLFAFLNACWDGLSTSLAWERSCKRQGFPGPRT